MKKKLLISLASFLSSALVILVVVAIIVLTTKPVDINAATVQLEIEHTSTVNVYVTGSDVAYDDVNSNLQNKIYHVESGTKVTLRAVNDSRIFESWVVNGTEVTSNPYTFTVSEGTEVTINRREPVGTDMGSYMYSRFDIDDAIDLLVVERLLSSAYDNFTDEQKIKCYDIFLSGYPVYEDLTDPTDKINFINENKFREKIQNGYFKVTGNIAMMDTTNFVGIGTSSMPFKGVFCGENSGINSRIITVVSKAETTGNNYYGLFGVLSPSAVVRNLEIQTSVGITPTTNSGNIYAGGVAGLNNNGLLYNLNVTTILGINVKSSNVYAGGIAGKFEGGLSQMNKVIYNGSGADWSITNQSTSSLSISAGFIAGIVETTSTYDYYFKDLEIYTDDSTSNITNNTTDINSKTYAGSLIGQLNVAHAMTIADINVINHGHAKIQSNINYGNSYVGGLIGYVNATANLTIGDVSFDSVDSAKSTYLSQSMNANTHANLYSAGLIAYINDTTYSKVVANDDFKTGIEHSIIDGIEVTNYDYIFEGNFEIESKNNGASDSSTYGKAVAAGLVAYGVMDINGSGSSDHSQILLSTNGIFKVDATQSYSSTSSDTYVEHCIASLMFGLLLNSSVTYKFNYIDVYASNAYVNAEREIGSTAIGDLHAAGFIGYSNGIHYDGIELYLNNSRIDLNSLSYEANLSSEGNNAYCGGVIGRAVGTNDTELYNLKVSGYNEDNLVETGTTVVIDSIQNTQPGGDNYRGENYVGGIIGQVFGAKEANGLTFIGSTLETDKIVSQGHQSPDSAFCGGVIGHIRIDNDASAISSVKNVIVKDTSIEGYATTVEDYTDPDVYVGGAIGACYCDYGSATVNYIDVYVSSTNIIGIGNENIQIFVSGIIGGTTWSGKQNFTNCYVYNCNIRAEANALSSSNKKDIANAAGIIGHNFDTASILTGCCVIDSNITAYSKYKQSYASGFVLFGPSSVYMLGGFLPIPISNNGSANMSSCYINSSLEATSGQSTDVHKSIYTVRRDGNNSSVTLNNVFFAGKSYYSSSYEDKADKQFYINLNDYSVSEKTRLSLFYHKAEGTGIYTYNSINFDSSDRFKLRLKQNESSVFETTSSVDGTWVNAKSERYGQDIAEVWVNPSASGGDLIADVEGNHLNGWFKIGEILLYNSESGSGGDNEAINEDININYIHGDDVYEHDYDYYLKNVIDSDSILLSGYKETDAYDEVNLGNNYRIVKEIDVKLLDDMPYIQIKFTSEKDLVYNPILRNDSQVLDFKTYGSYTFSSENLDDVQEHIFRFYPNEEFYSDGNSEFYLTFKVGSSEFDTGCIKFTFDPNIKEVVDYETASYTPALNYAEIDTGTEGNPLILYVGSTTKFIPIIEKDNDYNKIRDNSDTNTQYVNYTVSSTTGITMKTSGELVINSYSAGTYKLTITPKAGKAVGEEITIYFTITNTTYNVSTNATGADIEGITKASDACDYYFSIVKYSGYSGNLDALTIKIGETTYDLKNTIPDGITVKVGENQIKNTSGFKDGVERYDIIIDSGLIKGNITITTSLSIVYEVKFILNNDLFNPTFSGKKEWVTHVKAGTTFKENFGTEASPKDELTAIQQWTESGKLFGFIFNGYFLVENANSMNSYGDSFENLIKNSPNMPITTSITFYGSWSFLIELIEAPGTVIKSSFPEDFMKEYTHENDDDSNPDDLVSGYIKIPINCNAGYVFTIEKEEGFVGEASVRAFSATEFFVAEDEKQIEITEITIEKYHDNMYLYFIPPEKITGYLVIQTSASSSEIIVGENTDSVVEEVVPVDGVYTFKYLINHKKETDDQTFIYNAVEANSNLEKNFILEFFKQTYDPTQVYATYASETLSVDVRRGTLGTDNIGTKNIHSIIMGTTHDNDTLITSHQMGYAINTLTLYVSNNSTTNFKVEGSVDGVNWVSIDTVSNNTSVDENDINNLLQSTLTYTFNASNNYKYFRIDNVSGEDQKIYQITVNGTSNSSVLNLTTNPKMAYSDGFSSEARPLAKGTVIEMYYHKYINGTSVQTIVGNYVVESDDSVYSLFLHQFTLLDGITPAFNSTEKFSTFLGTANQAISEEYYFVITPPNGLSYDDLGYADGEEMNFLINSGYVYNDNGEYKYIEGNRNSDDIQNNPLEDALEDLIIKETSKQTKIYAVTDSRGTDLIVDGTDVTFKDETKYTAFSFKVDNGTIVSYDDGGVMKYYLNVGDVAGNNTIIYTDELDFYIGELSFIAGFNTGIIKVSGGTIVDGNIVWSTPYEVNINSQEYQTYTLDFRYEDYRCFKIDNASGKDIHITELNIKDKVTDIVYDIEFNNELTNNLNTCTDFVFDFTYEIKGDNRHEGASFILAVQFKDGDNVVQDLDLSKVYLTVNGVKVYANNYTLTGNNVAYFNLSALLTDELQEISFTIEFGDYSGYSKVMQLLEVTNTEKPAMGEVRVQYIDGVKVPFETSGLTR